MIAALLTLNALPRVGPIRLRRLLKHFGNAEAILEGSPSELQQVSGVGPEVASIITDWQSHADPERELALCEQHAISILTPDSPLWPRTLKECHDAPLLLYVMGEITAADQHAIGMVGSRRCTHYGRAVTRNLGRGLTTAGYSIISGLARGIDTEAHEAALDANGRTIAVLGSGLLDIYPSENKGLARRITDGHGAVVSEFSLLHPPDKQTFPQRNRIVANWCSALVVTESPRRSGSLITANMATDTGRPVYAVPGPIDRPQSEGCHDLIREGATLATKPEHILDDLHNLPLFREKKNVSKQDEAVIEAPMPELTEYEALIFPHLDSTERTMDQISDLTEQPIHIVSASLLGLELKRLVTKIAGQKYIRKLK